MGQGQQELMGGDMNRPRGMVGGELILRFLVGLTERMVMPGEQMGTSGGKQTREG